MTTSSTPWQWSIGTGRDGVQLWKAYVPWYNAGETGAKAAKIEEVSGRQASRAVNPPPLDFPHA